MQLNEPWEAFIKNNGADFVRFVDLSSLPEETRSEYTCAVFFGKALTKEYIKALKTGQTPERQEFGEAEHAMDDLADTLAEKLISEGYPSISELEFALLPHKTVARMAGFGFIGKNTLLVSEEYGCAAVLGKILTAAPFSLTHTQPKESQCGNCRVCADVCPSKALSGNPWSPVTHRDEMLNENLCTTCLKCMIHCPYTERYTEGSGL